MKKAGLIAALLALCLMLSGCITINMQQPTLPQEAPVDASAQAQPQVAEDEGDELDFSIEDLIVDDGEVDWDIERTIVPATSADQIGDVKVDYVIQDDKFEDQCTEIAYYYEDYVGKNISLTGYVYHYDEGTDAETQFAVVRDIDEHNEEDYIDSETGEVIEHDHDGALAGFDCQYTAAMPAEGAWVRIVGTLSEYLYTDAESGESFDAMMLKILYLEEIEAPKA